MWLAVANGWSPNMPIGKATHFSRENKLFVMGFSTRRLEAVIIPSQMEQRADSSVHLDWSL